MNKHAHVISNCLLYLSAIAFVLFYLILSYYNRPVYDDMGNIFYSKGRNIAEYVTLFYNGFGGRWISWAYIYAVLCTSDNFQSIPSHIFIYYCFSLLVFVYSVNEIIRLGIPKLFGTHLDKWTTITYSVLFIASFYFFTFQNIEAWWYVCSSTHYLQGVIFFLLGIAFMLREKKKSWNYMIISASFVYVGSGFEGYTLIVGALFMIFIAYLFFRKRTAFLSYKTHWFSKGFIVAFVSLSVSAIISMVAPGNAVRRAYFKANFQEYYHPINWNAVFSSLTETKMIAAVVLSAIWILIGIKLKTENAVTINKARIKKTGILIIVALFSSFFILYFFSILFTFGIMPPPRAWTFTSFMLAVAACFSFLLLGFYIQFPKIVINYFIKIFIPVSVLVILSINLYNQYNYTSRYSKSYDELIASFLEAKENKIKGPFYMQPLPPSGMLMQLDMEDPTSNPIYLKKILGLDFEVIVKK